MKKTIVFIALFTLVNLLCYPKNISPAFQGARWTYCYADPERINFLYFYVDGDTIINNISRSKFYLTSDETKRISYLIGFLHITEKKYYLRYEENEEAYHINGFKGLLLDSHKDYAICDFSLKKGDEFTMYRDKYSDVKKYVYDVDSIELGSEKRKSYAMKNNPDSEWISDYWIEGMGSVNYGIIFEFLEAWPTAEWSKSFVCYSENDKTLYLNPFFDECPQFSPQSIKHPNKESSLITFSPNPMGNETKLISVFPMEEIILSDLSGRTIRKIACGGKLEYTLFRESLPTGIYPVKVVFQNGRLEAGKLVIK